IDLAILPIGDNFTMGPDEGLRAIKLIEPKQVIPIHYDTFDMIKQDPDAWKDRVEGETSARVLVLRPGEHVEL
ncbi:MAG: MBL fold metallo-hydrolase, partial [Deltaproteobacteria bacterium]